MEKLTYDFEGERATKNRAHVGAVASGDLEILAEPRPGGGSTVRITTSVDGFGQIWRSVLEQFFSRTNLAVDIEINDSGATPGTVALRLSQLEELLT
ncbi:malonate decarboxylase acyl carrier protein [Rhodococcus daqingensis]|uniref:Malonate decarboxylase acyl carrier protein n=1 Tax=Rhodococcus daqingensis TaxID=2479363 RepID=A0ABW2RW30_9NOCA